MKSENRLLITKGSKSHLYSFLITNNKTILILFYRYSTQPKGQLLYESRHLLTARFAKDNTHTYLRGQCKASMKKVVYVVDIKLSKDGIIEECHCDCAAGSGTQACCKHVSVLLFGVHEMVHKKTIRLHQSCTQKLSTYNRPSKVFYNSPIAAQNLPTKRLKSCNFNPLNDSDIIENYSDYVRNLVIGYGESSMPLLQTFKPANPHGIEWDHYPYLEKTPEDILLEKLLLKNVTPEQIQAVENNTRAQSNSDEWHQIRSCRITASMFYVVSHSKAYTKSLIEKIMEPKTVHTRALAYGKIHEPIAITQYEDKYSLNVQKCGLFISSEYPFLAASPDGLLGDDTVVEVKCPYSARNYEISDVTVPYLEKRNGVFTLKKQHPYYAQIQGQLYCTCRQYCNLIIYTCEDMRVVFVDRDDSYINEMLTHLINFYVHCLEPALLNKYMYKDYLQLIKKD